MLEMFFYSGFAWVNASSLIPCLFQMVFFKVKN